MISVNRVILVGRIDKTPQLRVTPGGRALVSVNLATTGTWKDRNTGLKRETTEWHRLVLENELAEEVARLACKGALLYVEGKLRTRKFTQNDVEKVSTEVDVTAMQVLDTPASKTRDASYRTGPGYRPSPAARPLPMRDAETIY
jgi:single-strand DNA-binding protein